MFLTKPEPERVTIPLKEDSAFETDINRLICMPFENTVVKVPLRLIRGLSRQEHKIGPSKI